MIVKSRNDQIIIPNIITANTGENERITPERISPITDHTPNVILLRARIVAYSLGLA